MGRSYLKIKLFMQFICNVQAVWYLNVLEKHRCCGCYTIKYFSCIENWCQFTINSLQIQVSSIIFRSIKWGGNLLSWHLAIKRKSFSVVYKIKTFSNPVPQDVVFCSCNFFVIRYSAIKPPLKNDYTQIIYYCH